MMTQTLTFLFFPALMAFAASSDLFTMTISNRVALVVVAGFFVMAMFSGMNLQVVIWHVAAALAVLAVTVVFFARGWIGGGDAKLAAATSLWLGFDYLLPYIVYASIFGGILTLALLRFRQMPLPMALAKQDWVERLHKAGNGVPYGIALAAAALLIYPDTAWMQPG